MRIADIVGAFDDRPDAVLVGTDAAADVAARVADALGLPAGTSRPQPDASVVVLATADEDLPAALTAALERAGPLAAADTVLLLLSVDVEGFAVEVVASAAADRGLELVEVVELAHPTLDTALRLVATQDPALAAARTELLLERATSRRARQTAAVVARELERRGERIDALKAEVTELRERLETAEVTWERSAARRDRELTVLRREVGHLETSTSYRIGHALVRLVTEPRLWLRVPRVILRWLRS